MGEKYPACGNDSTCLIRAISRDKRIGKPKKCKRISYLTALAARGTVTPLPNREFCRAKKRHCQTVTSC